MPAYRSPAEPDVEPPDAEALALQAIGKKARRVHVFVGLPVLLAGLVAGVLAYMFVRSGFFGMMGAHSPYITGAVTVAPLLGLSYKGGQRLARRIVAWRSRAWVEATAKEYGVAKEGLEDLAKAFT